MNNNLFINSKNIKWKIRNVRCECLYKFRLFFVATILFSNNKININCYGELIIIVPIFWAFNLLW